MSGIGRLKRRIEYLLDEMGYSKETVEYEYCIKQRDTILESKANNRDRARMLRYLGHIIHKLPLKRQVKPFEPTYTIVEPSDELKELFSIIHKRAYEELMDIKHENETNE